MPKVAEGMLAMVMFRRRKEATLPRGASVLVEEMILADDDASMDQTQGVVNLGRSSKAIALELDHPPSEMIEGLAHGEILVLPLTPRFPDPS